VVAAWALLLAATTLLTAGTLYADAVALGGLRAAVDAAPAADRSVRVSMSSRPANFAVLDAAVRGELERVVAAGGGGNVDVFLASGSMSPASESSAGSTLTILATRPGIEDHATLSSGRWPQPNAAVAEAALSAPAAALFGVTTGGRLELVDRIHPGAPLAFAIVGVYAPDPNDEWWLGNALDLQGRSVQGSFTTIGPVVLTQDDVLKVAPGGSISVEWRGTPAVEALTADGLTTLSAAATAFPDRLRAALPGGSSPRIETDLPAILGRVDRSVLVGRSGVLVLVLEFAVVAAYAIVLVAGMLADRRRAETALIRTRGASGGHVAGIALVEAVLLAGTAALIAPWLSLGIVGALGTSGALTAARGNLSLSSAALTADGLAALAGIVAMTLPNLGGIPSLAGVRAAIARQAGRTLGQRLGLDLALVVLAGIALWQLRLYGAPLTSNARGVLGIDPLLVAAPGIGLLAGALLATRLLPRAAEVAEPILARGRGLVGAIGGRGVARRPLRYTRSALLLMLAAALGTFATANVATWSRSQADQAAYRAGADVRLTPSGNATTAVPDIGAWSSLPGVTGVMAVDRLDVDSGRSVRGGAVLAVDPGSTGPVIARLPEGDAVGLSEGMAALAEARPNPEGIAIPDAARRLSLVVDLGLEIITEVAIDGGFATGDLKDDKGFQVELVYADAAGRLHRASSAIVALAGTGVRLEIPIDASSSAPGGATAPGRVLRAVEVTIAPTQFYGVGGTIDLGPLEWSGATTADAGGWAEVAPLTARSPAWSGDVESQAGIVMAPYQPPADHPTRLILGGVGLPKPDELAPAFGSGQTVRARIAWLGGLGALAAAPTLPVIASDRFLALTASQVGDHLAGAIRGSSVDLSIVGTASEFPTLDPSKPFILVDAPTLVLARYAANGTTDSPGEWWLSSSDPDATAAALTALNSDATVVSRTRMERELRGDPLALGVIGLLGLGSLAAMVFAAIGFIVSATVSTAEREGELALLRALGLSGGQLSSWLSAEHGLLLVAGLGGGVALGVLLAWLVLPFSTLTTTGAAAVPAPVVIVPIDGLLPVVGLAALVFVVTVVVLRRQLLRLRIGSALRARDE
ncbi:MAG TPA: FtsX-like permease family protein, partial [Candidatus Limnocylindrales bacterium]